MLVANGVDVRVDARDSWVPTPALSHAILAYNRGKDAADPSRSDGIVVTPSHNPPRDGGFKYNPPNGGPADTDATGWIADRANELIAAGLEGVARTPFRDLDADTLGEYDFRDAYVRDLANIIDVEAIRRAGVRIGADPLGGASVEYWALIAEVHGLDLTVVNPDVDPTWRFMTLDWDEKIRMDPSSPSAMAGARRPPRRVRHPHRQRRRRRPPRHRHARRRADEPQPLPRGRDRLPVLAPPGVAGGCRDRQDPRLVDDHRPRRRIARAHAARGAGRVQVVRAGPARRLGRVRRRGVGGRVVPAHATARSGRPTRTASCCACSPPRSSRSPARRPSQRYAELEAEFGASAYQRVDAPASPAQKAALGKLAPEAVTATELAGEPITAKLSHAPGNGAAIGGLKVQTEHAWFAARPSGTEDVYKLYAESLRGPEHLAQVQAEAREVVSQALAGA